MRRMHLWVSVLAIAFLSMPLTARAQRARTQILEGLDVEDGGDAIVVELRFAAPIAYLGHAPMNRGSEVRVQLRPIGRDVGVSRQTFRPGRDHPSGIESIEVREEVTGDASLEIAFRRTSEFRIEQEPDARRLRLRILKPGHAHAASPDDEARAAEMMAEGRRAMTAGEYSRAVLIFSGVLELSGVSQAPDALELLGLAREREGRLAHARAEYQAYLERYPDSEGADRVRQRLAVITLPKADATKPMRVQPEDGPRIEVDSFGRLYVGYRRESLFSQGVEIPLDDSIYSDAYVDTRIRRPGWTIRSQLGASLRYDLEFDEIDPRIYSAFVELRNDRSGAWGSFGRRSAGAAGVIGRFDGLQLRYDLGDRYELGAIAGVPLDSSSWSDFDTGRYLGGLQLRMQPFSERLDVQLFGIAQTVEGGIDRAALGGEARWFDDGRMVSGFLDYDVYFNSLNVAQLFASWDLGGRTFLSGTFDHRNVPILTSRNALVGFPGDYSQLENLFSQSEIEQRARDQTGRATTLTLSGSHRITPQVQVGGDFTAGHYSGTDGTLDVPGVSGTGIQFGYTARLVVNEMLMSRDVGVVSLRYFDGNGFDQVLATLDARFPVLADLRLNPRAWIEYRRTGSSVEAGRIRGSLRADYRLWVLDLEAEGGGEWNKVLSGIGDDTTGYFFMVGARYDF